MQLPTHTLTVPLTSDDEQTLRQALANHNRIVQVIQQAKNVGMDVSQHEARSAIHHGFITNALNQFFPTTTKPPTATDEEMG
jgi:hypothetical protein